MGKIAAYNQEEFFGGVEVGAQQLMRVMQIQMSESLCACF